jgi:hypothetical protein
VHVKTGEEVFARTNEGRADGETAAYQIAEVYAYRGDKDRAFECWSVREGSATPVWPICPLLLANLYDDPRWNAFLRTMRLADDQLKTSGR